MFGFGEATKNEYFSMATKKNVQSLKKSIADTLKMKFIYHHYRKGFIMQKRKTMSVELIKTMANDLLQDDHIKQETKAGICTMIEKVLCASNNYKGFNHLFWLNFGCKEWNRNGRPEQWPEKEAYISDNKKQEYSRLYY